MVAVRITPVPVEGPCVFLGCVSRDRHWHGGFPGGYDNPADPGGRPIDFTREPAPGVRDYNGALLEPRPPATCPDCRHAVSCHTRGGMCDGDGTVCHCVRIPEWDGTIR